MDLISEVLAFSRDYVNGNQTKERRQKIASAYRNLFGEKMKTGCSTCYIEAIFKIIHQMEKSPCSFKLKPGALLRTFGDETKTCTNANLTDELAEFHIKTNPGCIKKFAYPSQEEIQKMFLGNPIPDLEIVPPVLEKKIEQPANTIPPVKKEEPAKTIPDKKKPVRSKSKK